MNTNRSFADHLLCRFSPFAAVIAVFATLLYIPSSGLCLPPSGSAQEVSQAATVTTSFDIPDRVEFAGMTISLSRYDMRERYDREQLAFVHNPASTTLIIKRANVYFPIIEPILKEYGIPNDFKYLAVVESHFNPRAVSSAKAAGIWQFMPETGKQYDLEVTDSVDERYHVIKSTRAACRYLQDAYQIFGNWICAAASYNTGMNRITREQQSQLTQNCFDLLLFDETSRYIFRILAIKEILRQPQKYGFYIKRQHLYPAIGFYEIAVTESVSSWVEFARNFGITYAQLKDFNVWIRGNKLENKTNKVYEVRIPRREDLLFNPRRIKVYQENWVID